MLQPGPVFAGPASPRALCRVAARWRHGVVLDAQAPHPPCCPSGYVIVEGWALCDDRVVKALGFRV